MPVRNATCWSPRSLKGKLLPTRLVSTGSIKTPTRTARHARNEMIMMLYG